MPKFLLAVGLAILMSAEVQQLQTRVQSDLSDALNAVAKIAIPDLQAASADAKAHNDIEAAQCWDDGLVRLSRPSRPRARRPPSSPRAPPASSSPSVTPSRAARPAPRYLSVFFESAGPIDWDRIKREQVPALTPAEIAERAARLA